MNRNLFHGPQLFNFSRFVSLSLVVDYAKLRFVLFRQLVTVILLALSTAVNARATLTPLLDWSRATVSVSALWRARAATPVSTDTGTSRLTTLTAVKVSGI